MCRSVWQNFSFYTASACPVVAGTWWNEKAKKYTEHRKLSLFSYSSLTRKISKNATCSLIDLRRILVPILDFNTTVVIRIYKEGAVLLFVDRG